MTLDEGYIKYRSDWVPGPAIDTTTAEHLDTWRRPLFDAGLVGHYEEHDIGYGNISVRGSDGHSFIITATQTGHLRSTGAEHYTLVSDFSLAENRVSSTGIAQPSSEALTHAALYALDTTIGAVVHVHSQTLWSRHRDRLPTSNPKVAYGTPAMAREFVRLHAATDFAESGIAIMAGHAEGIISIGTNLPEAAQRILALAAAD